MVAGSQVRADTAVEVETEGQKCCPISPVTPVSNIKVTFLVKHLRPSLTFLLIHYRCSYAGFFVPAKKQTKILAVTRYLENIPEVQVCRSSLVSK